MRSRASSISTSALTVTRVVTVTGDVTRLERDAPSFVNYNLAPTTSLRLTTPPNMSLWVDKVRNTTSTPHLTKFITHFLVYSTALKHSMS
jgi:hypothetical protein